MSAAFDEKVIEVVSVPQGHVLFKQGDKGDAAYLVNDGVVGIYREANGRKVLLATNATECVVNRPHHANTPLCERGPE